MQDIRVVKVGGSLFDWDELPQRIRSWVERQPAAANVLIAGGGPIADVVRAADARYQIGEEPAHWLCIDAMRLMSRLLLHMLPEAEWIDSYRQLTRRLQGAASEATSGRLCILNPQRFLEDEEPKLSGRRLPHGWHVTSDSIAARLAETLDASELVLLKSADPPPSSLQTAAEHGYVDPYFPRAAAPLPPVRFVNLRAT